MGPRTARGDLTTQVEISSNRGECRLTKALRLTMLRTGPFEVSASRVGEPLVLLQSNAVKVCGSQSARLLCIQISDYEAAINLLQLDCEAKSTDEQELVPNPIGHEPRLQRSAQVSKNLGAYVYINLRACR
jgi:hypothetical protein